MLAGYIPATKPIRQTLLLFAAAVMLNELLLGIQGIASISYTVVPFANEMLFAVALFMMMSVAWLIRAVSNQTPKSTLV
jgi:hypothetical protein